MVLGIAAMCGPYGFVTTAKLRRIQKIEDRLPDFLRDVAEAGRFGMTLPDAIIVASRGRYGLLTEEIKKMASQLEWGVPVATALQLFEERVPTPLVQRVVSIITRANEAGGNVADVLTMVAHDTREVQLGNEAREISMLTYVTVIYISFYVFLVTIYIMAAVFLPQMVTAGQGISLERLAGAGAVNLAFTLRPGAVHRLPARGHRPRRRGRHHGGRPLLRDGSPKGSSTRRSCSCRAGRSCGSSSRTSGRDGHGRARSTQSPNAPRDRTTAAAQRRRPGVLARG